MLVWRAHKDTKTILWKAVEKDDRRGGGQDLFLKLSHARVAGGALRNPQKHGIFRRERRGVQTGVLRRVRKKFSSTAEQEERP